ncbi:hypothetical protein PCCS19_18570 [Paenibacillus sp. CCS19]|uniref:hypothetical protein n=1 Tax=Paenibacillus sp. CCS19 TaxID=3158387 RepID=UPI00255F87F2|nr:hypothetical protein [Paenibacillus cellulosilyticus]GMK38803.1 hypothetical protein PCCS19_18570 [Paenibacillus cellulosilyticus]
MGNKLIAMIKDNFQPLSEEGLPLILEASIDGVLGQIASGLVSFRLSYKQRKFEENTTQALKSLLKRTRKLDAKLDNLTDEVRHNIAARVLPITFDYVQDELELEKIEFIINGFESAVEGMITEESVIIAYHDVLKELRMAEIRKLIEFDLRNINRELNINLDLIMDRSREGRRTQSTVSGYEKYVESKLTQIGLIHKEFEGGIVAGEGVGRPVTRLTEFGKNLLDYFKMLELT